MSTSKESIADYGYYADFNKVYKNVGKIKIELNILNSPVGSNEIEPDFLKLVEQYPEILKCIPILLAVRDNEIYAEDEDGKFTYLFEKQNQTPEQYCKFMRKTGLFDLLQNHIINNVVDYVTGVEAGLDSNGRKNRGGHLMEKHVAERVKDAGFVENKSYFKEMYLHQISDKWGVDLSAISNKGKAEKRFDFVVKTDSQVYVVETNCYSSGGSKLNETASAINRLYKKLIWLTALPLFGLQTEKDGAGPSIILKKPLLSWSTFIILTISKME